MSNKELYEIKGGAVAINLTSASYLNALTRGITTLYNLGKALGSAVIYAVKGKSC